MAETPACLEDTLPAEEETEEPEDFQQMITHIGGKERIYLVSDGCKSEEEEEDDDAGMLQEFIRDVFKSSGSSGNVNGHLLSSSPPPGHLRSSSPPPGHLLRSSPPPGHLRSSPPGSRGDAETVRCKEVVPLSTRPEEDLGPRAQKQPAAEFKKKGRNGDALRTATSGVDVCSPTRTIDAPIIIFLFRREFLAETANEVCAEEILRDVRARTKRAPRSNARPALLGLIRVTTAQDSAAEEETRRCARLLERLMRSVFRRHPPETIWVGIFTPGTEATVVAIRKNACRVLYSSQAAADNASDRGDPPFCPLWCFPWPLRRGIRGLQADSSPTSKQRGISGSMEEGIPLKTNSLSTGPHVD